MAFVCKEQEIDRIPLAEVNSVKANVETTVMKNHERNDQRGQVGQSQQDFFCLQVATQPEGYNSGRTYTFRTRSKELHDEISSLLNKLVDESKKLAEANSCFRKAQWKVKEIYDNSVCQSMIAVIILGVSYCLTIEVPAVLLACSPTFMSLFSRASLAQ